MLQDISQVTQRDYPQIVFFRQISSRFSAMKKYGKNELSRESYLKRNSEHTYIENLFNDFRMTESSTCETLGTVDFSMNRPLYGHKKLVHRGWRSRGGMPANYCDTTEIEDPTAFV